MGDLKSLFRLLVDACCHFKVDLTYVFEHLLHKITERSSVVRGTFVCKHASKWLFAEGPQVNFIDVICLPEKLLEQAFNLVHPVNLNFDFSIPSACLIYYLFVEFVFDNWQNKLGSKI